MMKKLKSESGIAMVMTMYFMVVIVGFSFLLTLRAIHESRMTKAEINQTRGFYTAQAALQTALEEIDTLINTDLVDTLSTASPSGVFTYCVQMVSRGDGVDWLVNSVRRNNVNMLVANGEEATFTTASTFGSYPYTYSVTFTENGEPSTAGTEAWDFPFTYNVQAVSTLNSSNNQVRLDGDFTIRVQRDNFAKYALFTNRQQTQSGGNVWFTDKTNFAGPVHTNDRFNIALSPSATFEAAVSQYQTRTRYYNNGWPVLLDADFNGVSDVPTFNSSFTRGASAITLNSSVGMPQMISQATGGQTINSNGIHLPNNGSSLTGGIYVRGDSTVSMTVDSSNNPVYTIVQGSNIKTITVDSVNNTTTVDNLSVGSTQTYNGKPDGVDDAGTLIFVDGNLNGISGTVESNTQLTVASSNDVIISDHIEYQNYTPAIGSPGQSNYVPPSATGASNLLGLVSWQGNVRVGTTAPNDLNVHASIMAAQGVFQVDSYNSSALGPRGTATLLGGAISDDYGAFGTFSGSTGQQRSGYGRNFVYDDRLQNGGVNPPYFPTLQTFIAFTNDLTDKLAWGEGE